MPTRRSRCSASTASPRSGSGSRCATAATSWRSAATSSGRWPRSRPSCRSASSRTLVADQAVTVDLAINEFTTSLWQAILIIIAASFVALGVRPGAVVALSIPLTLAIVFPVMDFFDIDLQRISLGALIIALTLLVDDAMTTVDAMIRRLAAGDSMEDAATFAYRTLAAPMLTGTLVTIAGFVPIGFAASTAGEYTFSIFAVVGISLIVSWFVAVMFAPLIGMTVLKAPKEQGAQEPGRVMRLYQRPADRRDARALADDRGHHRRCSPRRCSPSASCRSSSSRPPTVPSWWSI